jgi:CBS domain-containing protein
MAIGVVGREIGPWAQRQLSRFSNEGTADGRRGTIAPGADEDSSPRGAIDAEASPSVARTRSGSPAATVFAASAVVLLALACAVLLRRRRRRTCAARELVPQSETEARDLESRLFPKRQELLRLFARDADLLLKNRLAVRDLMTAEVITIPPETSRHRMREMMDERHIRHLLVCGPRGELLGVVSDRDLCGNRGPAAQDLMHRTVRTVSPDTRISPAITYLVNEGISCLPVVEDGRLCGILTVIDLILALQCMLQLWLHTAQMMHSETWEQNFLEMVRAQANATEADTCIGLQGLWSTIAASNGENQEASQAPGCVGA